MEVNLRKDSYFVQDSNWYSSESNYGNFISGTKGKSTVFLEPGVGYNTPGIMRYPFEAMVFKNPEALLIRLNRDHPEGMTENLESTIPFNEDMTKVINDLRNQTLCPEPCAPCPVPCAPCPEPCAPALCPDRFFSKDLTGIEYRYYQTII